MAGFDNDTMYANNVDFTGSTTPAPQVLNPGELLIGSSVAPRIRVATLTAGAGITITNGNGSITIAATGGVTPVGGLIPNAFTAPGTSPVVGNGAGNITVTGAQVAAGVVGTNVIRTDSLAANTLTIEIQRATSAAVSTPAANGVAHFDSAIFTVGAGGFVSLGGGPIPPVQQFNIDGSTPPGTDPVLATASGVVTITGNQTLSGVVGARAIRTFSSAANSYEVQIQRANTAAVANVVNNGISHYDSAIFTIDANAFVSLTGGSVPPAQKFAVDTSTPPGTNPVLPTAGGIVTITGAQVPTGTIGTNVIRTDSTAANSITVEIQRSTAVAGSDVTKNGVAHFNSAQFIVDPNGFVSSIGGGGGGATWQFIEVQTLVSVLTGTFNTSISNFTEIFFTFENLSGVANGQLVFQCSANNGATILPGFTAIEGLGSYPPLSSSGGYLVSQISAPFAYSGYLDVQNFIGNRLKVAYGLSMGNGNNTGGAGAAVFSYIINSPQLNWFQFSTTTATTFSVTITVYGR